MSSGQLASQPTQPTNLGDEIEALALQLEEIEVHFKESKGKYPVCNLPDIEVACSIFQVELQNHINFLNDSNLAHSIARAVESDATEIAILIQEEIQNQQDRHLALEIGGQHTDDEAPPPYCAQGPATVTAEEQALFEPHDPCLLECVFDSEDESDEAGPSTTAMQQQAQALAKVFQCVACLDRYPPFGIVRLQCCDQYCTNCLKDLFIRATKDQSLFPPRCCKHPIPLEHLIGVLTDEELETFRIAEVEFSTNDRTYCANVQCGKFILPAHIKGETAECDKCNTSTCVHCKNAVHHGDCPADPAIQATFALGESEGWRQCYRCKRLIELNRGCYHMTCICRAEFCYLCGVEWKKCPCDAWNECNLVNRAEEIVDREAHQPLAHQERNRRVLAMREELLGTHECEHPGRFERIFNAPRRGFRCDMCDHRHWKYIFQCRRCHLRACEDCRRNRL